jgi:hypothetical protein
MFPLIFVEGNHTVSCREIHVRHIGLKNLAIVGLCALVLGPGSFGFVLLSAVTQKLMGRQC